MYNLINNFKNKFHNKKEEFLDTKLKISYLINKFGSLSIDRFCINNHPLEKKFTREYFHYGTINYFKNYHEFIAFDLLGLLCGIRILEHEIDLATDHIAYDISNYTYAEINNIKLSFNELDEDYMENIIFLNFCSEFFKTKKFKLFYNNNKHEYIYIFNYLNPFYINLKKKRKILSTNFESILQINTFPIKNNRDDIHYKFFI